MAEMLGYRVDEMIGKPLQAFMKKEEAPQLDINFERRKSGVWEQHDFEFLHKDGTIIHTLLETAPIFEGDQFIGAVAGIIYPNRIRQTL